ncbi:MAG: Panacea domain-containing protein [Elainellaceae cyanobacterium]
MNDFHFNERKATQLASAFIQLSGGRLNYMKLIKLMYIADREALLCWERPISGDAYFALKHGPILSNVYTMISDGQAPSESNFWFDYIKRDGKYEVSLFKPCPPDDLSQAEEEIIHAAFDKYGHFDKWKLVDHLHNVLPEWNDPGASSFPISIGDILRAEGFSNKASSQVEAELESLCKAKSVFGAID